LECCDLLFLSEQQPSSLPEVLAISGFLPEWVLFVNTEVVRVFLQLNIPGNCLYGWWIGHKMAWHCIGINYNA
jgi:hypothetical protein